VTRLINGNGGRASSRNEVLNEVNSNKTKVSMKKRERRRRRKRRDEVE